jgi:hypothetical protein
MKISLMPSTGWRLREAPFPFQQTFGTPLKDLSRFVRSLLAPFEISKAAVWVETIVFTPNDLIDYLNAFGFSSDEGKLNRSIIQAENASEAATLLECVLSQWIDFAFIPSPKNFVIYADHDEFTTIFTLSKELLNSIRSDMNLQGFKEIENWMWTGPHSTVLIEDTKTDV